MKKLLLGLISLLIIFPVFPSQHDYVIDNAPGASVRTDINNVLQAIVTNNAAATEPSPTYSNMWWYDTSTGLLKRRNNANDAWITLGLEAADTDATLAANSDSKIPTQKAVKTYIDKSMPSGVILMWSGSVETIPTGWYLCNGSNGTPDLRDRFVIAAGGNYSVASTGDGSMPAHTHSHTLTAPAHQHTLVDSSGNTIWRHGGDTPAHYTWDGVYSPSSSGQVRVYTDSAGGGSLSGSISSTGSGTKNIAVYYALAYIMKGF